MNPNFVVLFVMLWLIPVGLPITIKRLHDRGKSGHWAWVLLLPLLANLPASELYPALGLFAKLAAILVPVLVLVALGMFRGQMGANRFGPPPSLIRYG